MNPSMKLPPKNLSVIRRLKSDLLTRTLQGSQRHHSAFGVQRHSVTEPLPNIVSPSAKSRPANYHLRSIIQVAVLCLSVRSISRRAFSRFAGPASNSTRQ
jgi:hypothetical protein